MIAQRSRVCRLWERTKGDMQILQARTYHCVASSGYYPSDLKCESFQSGWRRRATLKQACREVGIQVPFTTGRTSQHIFLKPVKNVTHRIFVNSSSAQNGTRTTAQRHGMKRCHAQLLLQRLPRYDNILEKLSLDEIQN